MSSFKHLGLIGLLLCNFYKANSFETKININTSQFDTTKILNHNEEAKAQEDIILCIENGEHNLIPLLVNDYRAKGQMSEAFKWELRQFALKLIGIPCLIDEKNGSSESVLAQILAFNYASIYKEYGAISLVDKKNALEWAQKHSLLLQYDFEKEDERESCFKKILMKKNPFGMDREEFEKEMNNQKKQLLDELKSCKEKILKDYDARVANFLNKDIQ